MAELTYTRVGDYYIPDLILDEEPEQTASASLALENGTYTLQITMSARAVNQLTETFWRLLPIVGIAVLAISLVASYFVTRLLTKPILEISDISKRLTTLDMTWRCDTSRTDEVGTLALNLNTMAARLDSTLKELSAANKKLQADIEQERRQEKLRVDFFRAVSHELKTPITVLKGETVKGHHGGVRVAEWFHLDRRSLNSAEITFLRRLGESLDGPDLEMLNWIIATFSH